MIGTVSPVSASELVGRDRELARLTGALGMAGAGGAVLLGGDAGIGKTALVGRLVDAAADRRVLVGHCVGEGGASLPYLPFVEILAALDARERDLVDELVAAHPGLAPLVPRTGLGTRGDTDRAGLVEAVHGALADLGRRGPLLVVVEDVHWADESTRELLTVLFTRRRLEGVGLLVTWRSDDVHRRHPLSGTLAVWSRLPELSRLDLGPLPEADLQLIVRRARPDLPAHSVEDAARRAEGNAYFAEELAAATGTGRADPGDLGRLLLARVDRLDEDAQALVRVAAVIGRRVPHGLLARVSGVDGATLRAGLRAAVEHHVLQPWDERGYAFRHALLAEAVSDDLLPTERLDLHRACVEALREDESLGTAADLARHALAAGDRASALDASVRAGEQARRMGGPAEALAQFEVGLTLVDEDPAAAHALTLAAAAAANAAGRAPRAMSLLRARLADRDVTPHQRAELLGALAFAARLTEDHVDRLALADEALALVTDDAPLRLRVGLLTRRAEALADLGDDEEALAVAEQALALAVEHDLVADRVDLTTILARLAEVAGDPGASIRRLQGVLEDRSLEPDLALLRAMHILASIHYRQADFGAALAGYERTATTARRAGLASSVYGVDSVAMAVTVAYEMGEWDRALELAEASRSDALPEGGAASVEAAAAYVRAARGELDPGLLLASTRPWWTEDSRIAVQAGSVAIEVHGRRGEVDGLLAVHDEVVDHLRAAWGRPHVATEVRLGALVVGHLADRLRHAPSADRTRLAGTGERIAASAGQVWGPGSTLAPPTLEGRLWLARLEAETARLRWVADTGTDRTDLVAAWRAALGLAEQQGDAYEIARTRARLGEILLAAGEDEAAGLLDGAREVAQRLGAVHVLAALDRVARRPARPAGTLTRREAEVLALLAQGRSNGDIGHALFISTKTASVHVSSILAKLGVASRGEAVAVARSRGLLDDGPG